MTIEPPAALPPRQDGRYRIVFMGTPDFAVPSFSTLVGDDRFDIVLAVSQPDRPQGRKRKILPTPVHRAALEVGIPCYQPEKLRHDPAVLDKLTGCRPDFIVTAAYGKILPAEFLEVPTIAAVNVHASLLPLYRGASPVHNSIIRGDRETGVTIMQMVEAMDAGGIYRQATLAIGPDETAAELMDRLAKLGAEILPETLLSIAAGHEPVPQDESQASYVAMLTREDGCIDWSQDAQTIHNLVRGTSPWPGAHTFLNGQIIKVHKTALPTILDLPEPLAALLAAESVAGQGQKAAACSLPRLPVGVAGAPGRILSCRSGRILVETGQGGIIELLLIQSAGGKPLEASQCAHNYRETDRFGSLSEIGPGED